MPLKHNPIKSTHSYKDEDIAYIKAMGELRHGDVCRLQDFKLTVSANACNTK